MIPITEDDFFGRTVIDFPPIQVDDELMYLPDLDRNNIAISQEHIDSSTLFPNWRDCLISDPNERAIFVLDSAKKEGWKAFKEEVMYIRSGLPSLIHTRDENDASPVSLKEILILIFGPNSDFATSFCNELAIDQVTFFNFLGTLALQMSYKESPSSLHDEYSLIKDHLLIKDGAKYIGIWKKIANLKKAISSNSGDYIGNSRRPMCLWEIFEAAANKTMRKIAIAGRTDDIFMAFDDNKIWVESSGENTSDDFKLRRVTHVRDNRKEIVSHTAISVTTTLPLGFMFEKKGDKAVDCFKKVYSNLFPSSSTASSNNLPDLIGVSSYTDQGYTIWDTIKNFLLASGADFTNTVKRIMPFPYLWGMKKSDRDPRTLLEEKGAPTLFIKELVESDQLMSCMAFRTGTNNVSAVLTKKIHGHQWEGICLKVKDRIAYEQDPKHGLDKLKFKVLAKDSSMMEEFQDEIETEIDELKTEKIDYLTVEQGTSCWHRGRQFSLTSSQASIPFGAALIVYQNNDDWCDVAKYLHGRDYHQRKLDKKIILFLCSHDLTFILFYFSIIETDYSGVTPRSRLVSDDEEESDGDKSDDSDKSNREAPTIDDYKSSMIEHFQSTESYSQGIRDEDKDEAIGIIIDLLTNHPNGSTTVGQRATADLFSN